MKEWILIYQGMLGISYRIKESQGANKQLDKYDENIKRACQLNRNNVFELSYNNDHGLDSGAWYKFIQSHKWEKYEYVFFMGEGALFTHCSALSDTLEFSQKNDIHFITGSQEKRFVSKDKWLGGFASSKTKNEMTLQDHDDIPQHVFPHILQRQSPTVTR